MNAPDQRPEETPDSIGDIQRRLVALENERNTLMDQLDRANAEQRKAFVASIRAECEKYGWDAAEIAAELSSRGKKARNASWKPKRVWIDPDNPEHRFVGRGLPGWMRDKMRGLGLDPGSREDRDRFRNEHLRVVEA
jgi:hypothetical protein